ncbi:MAG: hypothetical protein KBS75_09250 [Bacteroidales bacterium]|nr:hypothetical protein [Candidatus Equimonas faecalis]
MTQLGAMRIIDKLKARGFVYGKLSENEEANRVSDLCETYTGYADNDVVDAYVFYMNHNKDAPQPCDIIPVLRKQYATRSLAGLTYLTKDQINELLIICRQGCGVGVAFMDYAVSGDGHNEVVIRGSYEKFKARVEAALADGRLF